MQALRAKKPRVVTNHQTGNASPSEVLIFIHCIKAQSGNEVFCPSANAMFIPLWIILELAKEYRLLFGKGAGGGQVTTLILAKLFC